MEQIKMGPCDYSRGAPEGYTCGDCGAHGVRLWRDFQTAMVAQALRCAACAEQHQRKGRGPAWRSPYSLGQGDQIGWLVPAVPTVEGNTFWGYTSVPPEGVAWWKRLPSAL